MKSLSLMLFSNFFLLTIGCTRGDPSFHRLHPVDPVLFGNKSIFSILKSTLPLGDVSGTCGKDTTKIEISTDTIGWSKLDLLNETIYKNGFIETCWMTGQFEFKIDSANLYFNKNINDGPITYYFRALSGQYPSQKSELTVTYRPSAVLSLGKSIYSSTGNAQGSLFKLNYKIGRPNKASTQGVGFQIKSQ